MKLPEEFLQSLEGIAGFERKAFVSVHEGEETVTSIRINPAKWLVGETGLLNVHSFTPDYSQVPWSQYGFYLDKRPSFTFDPLFHAGCYYVQEASSMFLEQALKQLMDLSQPLKVLDLCAAPGGKSTHLQSLLSKDSLLVSNEVIKSRSVVLSDNIIKWGCSNVFVTNNDPKAFQKLPGYFDVMVVDAPCSGSGLFRKDKEAIGEWSLNNVALCSQRQQRILADALPALKEDGLLVYSTCSYSKEEDEGLVDWLVQEMGMENIELQKNIGDKSLKDLGIVITISEKASSVGYRFYPDKIKGEGFFMACFRKRKSEETPRLKSFKPVTISAKEKKVLEDWVNIEALEFFQYRNIIVALPKALVTDFMNLQLVLNIQYAGVAIGEILKERLVPHHALAQSLILSGNIPATDLNYDDAIKYLQRQDFSLQPTSLGWQLVRYQAHNLGWINALKNRVNNYYPKEIRILKQNNNLFEK